MRTSPFGACVDLVGDHLHLFVDFVELASHEALDREDGVLGVGDGLALGDLADEALAVLGEADHRRRGAAPLGVDDDLRLAAFHDRDDGVGRAEVDADDLGHNVFSFYDLDTVECTVIKFCCVSKPESSIVNSEPCKE